MQLQKQPLIYFLKNSCPENSHNKISREVSFSKVETLCEYNLALNSFFGLFSFTFSEQPHLKNTHERLTLQAFMQIS